MGAPRRAAGSVFLSLYRLGRRGLAKVFSLLAGGAFAEFGPRSVLEPPIRLSGEGRISIGADVYFGGGSWLQALGSDDAPIAIEIGDGTRAAGNCVISAVESVRIGPQVLFARNVYVADHRHAFEDQANPVLEQGITRTGPIEIAEGAWLGQNVVVGPGVRIGRGAVVGANSVVLADVPDHSVAVGAPARVVRSFEREPSPGGTPVPNDRG